MYRHGIFAGLLAFSLAAHASEASGQSLLSSEERYVRAWQMNKQGAFDAALAEYEAAAEGAVLATQKKKILRGLGEVATRPGAPAAQRTRGYRAFEEAALLGDGFSLGRMVELQDKNVYRPSSLMALIPLYEARARGGSNTTALLLGRMYEQGEIGSKDQAKALEWYSVAAQNGNGNAGIKLAVYHAGRGEDKEALRWLKLTRAQLTEAQLRSRVVQIFIDGEEVPRNVPVARRWALTIVPLEPGLAIQLLRKVLDAEFDLGTFEALITTNVKIKGQERATISLVRRIIDAQPATTQTQVSDRMLALAKNGNQFAAAVAASIMFQKNGFGHAPAMALVLGAISAGEPEAVRLGTDAIASLPAESAKRTELLNAIRTSAEKGTPEAMLALANIYSVGGFVAQDPAESFKWKLRAAQTGDAAGAFHAGMAYLDGNGVAKDANSARKWLDRAKRGGNAMAGAILQQIASTARRN